MDGMFNRMIRWLWPVPLLILLDGCGPQDETKRDVIPRGKAGIIDVIFTYGSEKEDWVEAVTADFNQRAVKDGAGKVIRVTSLRRDSSDCLDELMAGTTKAHLTSPASSIFIKRGNAQWRAKTGKDMVPSTESLVRSPIVIAMWKPMAEAIGWGRQPVGWGEIHGLVTDPQGWATRGEPAWGKFLFGHTNPQFSSSGLSSLFAEVYAAAGKPAGLTTEDVQRPEVARFVGDIEASVLHSGNSTGSLAGKMFANGWSYLHAAVLYESMLVGIYTQNEPPKVPIVAIYAKEGTFVSDHPVGIVDAKWGTAEPRDAARKYLDFLLAREQQEKAMEFGFRPARADVPLVAPLDAAHGVNPKEPQTTFEVPSVEVMDAMMKLWEQSTKR